MTLLNKIADKIGVSRTRARQIARQQGYRAPYNWDKIPGHLVRSLRISQAGSEKMFYHQQMGKLFTVFYDRMLPELNQLVEQDRITTGAGCLVYGDCYHLSEGYLNHFPNTSAYKNTSTTLMQVWYKGTVEHLQKTQRFINEQKNLPFEKTQKQVLIQKGELK